MTQKSEPRGGLPPVEAVAWDILADAQPGLSARDQLVRELTRTKKRDLVTTALALGKSRGHRWIIGGPKIWSKDELISYIARDGER